MILSDSSWGTSPTLPSSALGALTSISITPQSPRSSPQVCTSSWTVSNGDLNEVRRRHLRHVLARRPDFDPGGRLWQDPGGGGPEPVVMTFLALR